MLKEMPGKMTAQSSLASTWDSSWEAGGSLSEQEIEYMLHDPNFIAIVELDQQILNLNDSLERGWDNSHYSTLAQNLEFAQSRQEVEAMFLDAGIPNGSYLLDLFEEKYNKTVWLLRSNESQAIYGATTPYLKQLYKAAYVKFINDWNPTIPQNYDVCSQSYKSGMSQCDKEFMWNTAIAVGAAASASFFGTPVAGGATLIGSMAAAYGLDVICRQGVVEEWRQCRYSTYAVPINRTYLNLSDWELETQP